MKRIILTALKILLVSMAFAQSNLNITQDERISALLQKQKQINEVDNSFNGFRIQIFMEIGNAAIQHADSVTEVFKELFPEVPIYLSYGQPYYRLRVGNFRNRLEAEKWLRKIKPEFKEAFVATEKILSPLLIPKEEDTEAPPTTIDIND